MTTPVPQRRIHLRYLLVALMAVVAITVGVARPMLAGGTPNLSATDRVKANPPPTLFTDAQIRVVEAPIASQQAPARAAMAQWWKSHGTVVDDKGFQAWIETQIPALPAKSQRESELRQLEALNKTRTPAGIAAATWLEANGKKDIWLVYQHDQRELESAKTGKADKADLKIILKMAKSVTDTLKAKYQLSAPYVLEPSLRTSYVAKKGAVCPCSYPSRHAAREAGARTFLGELAPRRLADYRWMEAQVTFSRLYMAGHVQSDITAGSRLGDMIGEYVLVTRGRMPVPNHA